MIPGVMLTDEQIREVYLSIRATPKYQHWDDSGKGDRARRLARFQEWLIGVKEDKGDDDLRKGYLDHFENAFQFLNPVYRERIIRDPDRFRNAIKELLDDSVPVAVRLDRLLDGNRHIEGMGKGLATEYLMIAHPDKYCLWNGKTESGLAALGRMPMFGHGQTSGQRYNTVLRAVSKLRELNGSPNYLDTDMFLHFVGAPEEEGSTALSAVSATLPELGAARPVASIAQSLTASGLARDASLGAARTSRYSQDWTRNELVLALDLYYRAGVRRDGNDQAVQELASAIGRTQHSVAMKLHNFEALDPNISKKALENTSRLDSIIFENFSRRTDLLHDEADKIRIKLSEAGQLADPQTEEELRRIQGGSYHVEDREATTRVRRGQAAFAKAIKDNYGSACAICGIELSALLVASHIKPWADDPDHRLDPANGICLCVLHDRLFDEGLITLSPELTVVVARDLRTARAKGVQEIVAGIEGTRLKAPASSPPGELMLDYHRRAIFRGS